jgi:opacity protein-like surface antigen
MDETIVLSGFRPWRLKALIICLGIVVAFSLPRAVAGTELKDITPPACGTGTCCMDRDWTIELGTGAAWSNVRNGQPNQAYTLIPVTLTASLKIDDVSLDNFLGGWLRGYTEFYFQGEYQDIVRGPENHLEGLMAGPRYNFVQPGWVIVPFVEGGVGLGFADSNPIGGGLGQDFNFTFSAVAGARYDINPDLFVRVAVEYQHVSNAGLSEPEFANHPIDELGPKLSFGYSF